jgi:hypothetical protein
MTQKGVKLEIETIGECGCEPHECYCRHSKEYKKSMKIRNLTTMIGLNNPPGLGNGFRGF